MSWLIAGVASGFLMASVFVCAWVLMLFSMTKDPSPQFQAITRRVAPAKLALSGVFFAYPVWGIIGAVLGLLYKISIEQAPGSGIGSPNLVFTAAVLAVTLSMAAPVFILLRRAYRGILVIALAFMGLFGWFLPFFAA